MQKIELKLNENKINATNKVIYLMLTAALTVFHQSFRQKSLKNSWQEVCCTSLSLDCPQDSFGKYLDESRDKKCNFARVNNCQMEVKQLLVQDV